MRIDSEDSTFVEISQSLDIAKIFLCLIVVLGHICRMYHDTAAIHVVENKTVGFIFKVLISFEMQTFMAISGGVFCLQKYYLKKYGNMRAFMVNKSKRLLFPYVFFSLILVMPTMYYIGLSHGNILKYAIYNTVLAYDIRHLWFLPALYIITILFNVLYEYIEGKLGIAFLVCVVLAMMPKPFNLPFQVNNVCNYLIYFYIGYICVRYYDYVKDWLSNWFIIFIVAVTIIVSNMQNGNIIRPEISNIIYGIMGVILFFGLSIKLVPIRCSRFKVYEMLSQNSFGIYLFHAMIIYLIYYYFHDCFSNGYSVIPVFIVVIITSIFMLTLFRIVGLYSVLGERNRNKQIIA